MSGLDSGCCGWPTKPAHGLLDGVHDFGEIVSDCTRRKAQLLAERARAGLWANRHIGQRNSQLAPRAQQRQVQLAAAGPFVLALGGQAALVKRLP